MWKNRNIIVHGNDKENQTNQQCMRAYAVLEYIYSRRRLYLEKDKALLLDTVEEHKRLPLSTILNWLLLYKKYFQTSAKKARRNTMKGMKTLNHFSKKI